jgi:very-short-patch-repair endonuclease
VPATDDPASAVVPGPAALPAAEALRRAGRGARLSHESAATELGIELLHPDVNRLTVPRNRSRLTLPGWHVVRSDVPPLDRLVIDGVPCTAATRSVLDLARELPLEEAVVAADSALRQRLVPASDLRARLNAAHGRRAAAVRAVAGAMDPLAGSVLETLLRLTLRDAGLRPVTQHEIRDPDGRFVARVDFCWPAEGLIVEADGFAFHFDRAAYRADRERLNALERLGWRVLRFTWEDVVGRPEHVLALVRDCLDGLAA